MSCNRELSCVCVRAYQFSYGDMLCMSKGARRAAGIHSPYFLGMGRHCRECAT